MITSTFLQALRRFSRLTAVLALILIAGLTAAVAANAATYYVATYGSDSNSGSINQPFRTIKKSTSVMRAGDTLYIRSGTYDETVEGWDIPAGSPAQHTVVAGYENENPVIRCTYCNASAVVTLFARYITLQNFTIDASNTTNSSVCAHIESDQLFYQMTCLNAARDGLRVVGENTTIRSSHIKDCGRIQTELQDTKGLGIHALSNGASHTSNLLIEGNLIEGCRAGGIGVQQQGDTRNVIVRNNILRNFGANSTWPQLDGAVPQSGTGINFGHGSYFYAYNNLIYGVGRGGDCFLAWGGGLGRPEGSFFYFYNNTCHDTYIGIVALSGANNVIAMNNIFSSVEHIDVLGGGANNSNTNYVTNPDFVNPAAGDFHLKPGSPGIDQGINLSSILTTDLEEFARDSNYDIGAYEFNRGVSSVPPPSAPTQVVVSQF